MARYPRCKASGKLQYPDFGTAATAALKTSRMRGGLPLRPYQCDVCSAWHLTKKPASRLVPTVPGPFTPADLARLLGKKTTA